MSGPQIVGPRNASQPMPSTTAPTTGPQIVGPTPEMTERANAVSKCLKELKVPKGHSSEGLAREMCELEFDISKLK